jgi:hypothetical protein
VTRDGRIVLDRFRNHHFDGVAVEVHQISGPENAGVAHPVLDVDFSVSENVESSPAQMAFRRKAGLDGSSDRFEQF